MTRPSHSLPPAIFDAVLTLEDLARTDAMTKPRQVGGREHVQAVVNTGGQRDRLAVLILTALAEAAGLAETPGDPFCAECGTRDAGTYVVTYDGDDRTEVCRSCDVELALSQGES